MCVFVQHHTQSDTHVVRANLLSDLLYSWVLHNISFLYLSFLCLKSIFYRFPILVYPSFCMFAILHIWCLMFYDFVTYLHLSLHVSLHFHHLFVYKTSYLKFFLKKQFWQGMKRGCLFLPNKTCSFSALNGM